MHAQGSLTPPGAPAPFGRALSQVEPRIDVATLAGDANAVAVISQPGSYFLSANLSVPSGRSGIAITASNVTLDLRGFAITGAAGSIRGVELRGSFTTITIQDGSIVTTGDDGIGTTGASQVNVHFRNLSIRGCGGGILLSTNNGSSVSHCRISSCQNAGLDLGSGGEVSHCVVENTTSSSSALTALRGALVSHCRVTTVNTTGGASVGISGTEISHCAVTGVSGAGAGTVGIIATLVTSCAVSTVSNSATGTVQGITASGRVSDCSVTNVGSTGIGTPTGINASSVAGCRVSTIGNTGSTSTCTGIIGSPGNVTGCVVNTFTAGSSLAIGINSNQVSQCFVTNGSGAGSVFGISASQVERCNVENLDQTGGTFDVVGIVGNRVTDCIVRLLTSSGSNNAIGYNSYLLANNCVANGISQAAGTTPICFNPAAGGETRDCVASNTGGTGVQLTGANTVRGCRIQLADSGTGISCSGTRHRVEDNTINNCVTGILANVANSSGFIARNRVTNCTTNITALAAWQVGPTLSATDPVDATSPWANFTD